jgi:hypothetical protein
MNLRHTGSAERLAWSWLLAPLLPGGRDVVDHIAPLDALAAREAPALVSRLCLHSSVRFRLWERPVPGWVPREARRCEPGAIGSRGPVAPVPLSPTAPESPVPTRLRVLQSLALSVGSPFSPSRGTYPMATNRLRVLVSQRDCGRRLHCDHRPWAEVVARTWRGSLGRAAFVIQERRGSVTAVMASYVVLVDTTSRTPRDSR